MLKSTHKPAAAAPSPAPGSEPSLPAGWTEHRAPSGHSYYYNAETKQSTYTRPTVAAESLLPIDYNATTPSFGGLPAHSSAAFRHGSHFQSPNRDSGRGSFRGGRSYQDRSRRQQPEDRPRSKKPIPNCELWVLVMTKLGRRFVYNTEKDESFWKFPQDVLLAVIEMERVEREKQEAAEKENAEATRPEVINGLSLLPATAKADETQVENGHAQPAAEEDSDSYEEVEVTDDEDEDFDDEDAPSKKRKLEDESPQGPVEFNEDDIAYQLAQMGEDYGLDPGEYDNGDEEAYNEEGAEGLPLTEEDATALFRDLLSDFRINPYSTWEKIIEEGRIIDDDRYTVMPNMGARKHVFTEWSRDAIHVLQAKRAQEERKDPRIAYLRFLHEHATPKLYWVEFKRKFKREPEIKDGKLSDKEKEKIYRDYTSRLKLAESTRKAELENLLRDQPLRALNRDSTLDTMPPAVLTDLKFISLPVKARDELVEQFIATLPEAPEAAGSGELTVEEQAEVDKKKEERRKREAALAEREKRVQEEKRRQKGALRHGREMNEEAAVRLDEAMRVGKKGLMGYMDRDKQMEGAGGESNDMISE